MRLLPGFPTPSDDRRRNDPHRSSDTPTNPMTEPTNTTPTAPLRSDASRIVRACGQRACDGENAVLSLAAAHNRARARDERALVGAAIRGAGGGPERAATCR